MRPGGGKAKGSAFERTICKSLSLWITHGARDDVLWRSAMSGGRATVHAKRGQRMDHVGGDVCSVHPLGAAFVDKFYIELKCYRDLQIAQLLLPVGGSLIRTRHKPRGIGKKVSKKQRLNTLAQFWQDTIEKAAEAKKLPMLIFKQNVFPVMVCLTRFGIDEIEFDVPVVATFSPRDLSIVLFDRLIRSRYH